MSRVLGSKIKKSIFILLRQVTRPYAANGGMAERLYYMSDLALFKLKGVYVLPVFIYRLMTWLLNGIASFNTVDKRTLRSRRLQRAVDWMIHLIPDEIRFAEHARSAPGQRGVSASKP
jgi:hypothetical protein